MIDPSPPTLPRVLVVDDDDLLRSCLERVLRRVAVLAMSPDASDARGLLREQPFDVVVSDLSLPDGDGLTLLADAARVQPSAKLFVFSGREPPAEARRAFEGGILTGILRKPEGLSELIAFVRRCATGDIDTAAKGPTPLPRRRVPPARREGDAALGSLRPTSVGLAHQASPAAVPGPPRKRSRPASDRATSREGGPGPPQPGTQTRATAMA
ncbi:MAG TPA: response regulator [Polyangiaceae bacterium]|nr:response regulator [Polyangiaceae bacterium]